MRKNVNFGRTSLEEGGAYHSYRIMSTLRLFSRSDSFDVNNNNQYKVDEILYGIVQPGFSFEMRVLYILTLNIRLKNVLKTF